MKQFRASMQGAPLLVMFSWFTGFYFLGTYGFALLDGASKLTLTSALIRFVGALLFGGLMTALIARQRRRDGGVGMSVQIATAIKTGMVPEEAEPSSWTTALQARRQQNMRAHWLSPVVFGLFTVLGVFLITQDPNSFLAWIFVVFFVGIGVFSAIQAQAMVTKIDRLLAQVQVHPVGTTSSPDSTPPEKLQN